MLLRKTIGRDGLNNYAYPSGQTDRITTKFDWTLDCISAEVKVNVKLPNYASDAHSLLDQLTSGMDIPGEGFAMIGQNRMLEKFTPLTPKWKGHYRELFENLSRLSKPT
jgi:hypothetical protein